MPGHAGPDILPRGVLRVKAKTLLLSMLCLLIIPVSFPSSAAAPTPQFAVLGQGHFEVFVLEDGAVYATQWQRDVSRFPTVYLLQKSKDAQGNLSISKTEVEITRHKLQPEMLDPKAFSSPYLVSGFKRWGSFEDIEWFTINSGGREYIVGRTGAELSLDRRKLLLGDGFEREFLIYSCETGRVEVTVINAGRKDTYVNEQPIYWFSHAHWSRDGKRIAYDSNKVGWKNGFSIWILDQNREDCCVLNSKVSGSLSLLGWTFDNRLITETRSDEIRVYDLKGRFRSMAKRVIDISRTGSPKTGEEWLLVRSLRKALLAVGQSLISEQGPFLRFHNLRVTETIALSLGRQMGER